MNPSFSKKEFINSGSFGKVYKVVTNDNKVFALKEFKKVSDEEGLRKEVNNLSKLQHPHVVRIYGSYFVNECSILMEYCPLNLRKVIDQKITPDRAFRLFTEILESMNFIHKKNMVHNDLKPENILLDHKDSIKIGDFGLARQCDYLQWRDGSVQGTKMYLPPEVLNSSSPIYSSKVDMYAIGIILFEMYVSNCSTSLIQKLRSDPEGVACEMFPRENISPIKYEIVPQLLSKNQNQRPSAGHLMRSFKQSGHYYPKHQSNEKQKHESQHRSDAGDVSHHPRGHGSSHCSSCSHGSRSHRSGHHCSSSHGSGNPGSGHHCSRSHGSGNPRSGHHCSRSHGSGNSGSGHHCSGSPGSGHRGSSLTHGGLNLDCLSHGSHGSNSRCSSHNCPCCHGLCSYYSKTPQQSLSEARELKEVLQKFLALTIPGATSSPAAAAPRPPSSKISSFKLQLNPKSHQNPFEMAPMSFNNAPQGQCFEVCPPMLLPMCPPMGPPLCAPMCQPMCPPECLPVNYCPEPSPQQEGCHVQ